jgi:Uma2 family endonuclease
MSVAIANPPAVAPPRMSYEEFLTRYDGRSAEWVNGEVFLKGPVSNKHQDIAMFLVTVLGIYVRRRHLGVVSGGRFQMKTGPNLPGREPDVLFIANENLSRLRDNYLVGPADLVVEVSGLESRRCDCVDKYHEYEQVGVREYWLIDPTVRLAQFFQLGDDGRFHDMPLDPNGRYHSAMITGVWVCPDWFWEDTLPDELDLLQKWGV